MTIKTKNITFRLSLELIERLVLYCIAKGAHKSGVIRAALNEFLSREGF